MTKVLLKCRNVSTQVVIQTMDANTHYRFAYYEVKKIMLQTTKVTKNFRYRSVFEKPYTMDSTEFRGPMGYTMNGLNRVLAGKSK